MAFLFSVVRKTARCDGDLWQLIYEELDAKDLDGRISLIALDDEADDDRKGMGVFKVKSHISWEEYLARGTPFRHMALNELADRAADLATDHLGLWEESRKNADQHYQKLFRICWRIAYIEANIRVHQDKRPVVEADLIVEAEAESHRRMQDVIEKSKGNLDRVAGRHGHQLRKVTKVKNVTQEKAARIRKSMARCKALLDNETKFQEDCRSFADRAKRRYDLVVKHIRMMNLNGKAISDKQCKRLKEMLNRGTKLPELAALAPTETYEPSITEDIWHCVRCGWADTKGSATYWANRECGSIDLSVIPRIDDTVRQYKQLRSHTADASQITEDPKQVGEFYDPTGCMKVQAPLERCNRQ